MGIQTLKRGSFWLFAWAAFSLFIASGTHGPKAAWGDDDEEPSIFDVKPYLYLHGSGKLALSWRYLNGGLTDPLHIKLSIPPASGDSTSSIQELQLSPKNDGVTWNVELPLPECGFPAGIHYYVPGMKAPAEISPIPCAGEHKTVRFSFIADAQEGPEFLHDIAKLIEKNPGDALLSDGDLVQEGAHMQDWINYFQALYPVTASRAMVAAIGNHEYRSTDLTRYWQNFFQLKAPQAYYSVNLGDLHLMVLNTNFEDDSSLIEKQVQWLKKELLKPAAWRVVMFHHAPYSKGFFDGPGAIKKEHLVLRDRFVPLFEAYRIDLVLSGHTHIFERSVKAGIQYLVAGPAGGRMGTYGASNPYSLLDLRERTVTQFEVNETGLRGTTLSIDGRILDDFILNK